MPGLKVTIGKAEIDNTTMAGAVACIESLIERHSPSIVVTPNADHIVLLQRDRELLHTYQAADLVLADGAPLLWAARFLNTPLQEKISGSDLFPEVCRVAAEKEYRLFFMGGRPGSALRTASGLRRSYRNIRIVGVHCPPFGFEHDEAENLKSVRLIRDAGPDVLFVGLGSPKQEKWIHKHMRELGVPVCIGIGATFEFAGGIVKRAPRWMQRHGLEWFWRLTREPLRLWRRYLVDDMRFFWIVLQQKLNRRGARMRPPRVTR
jgi:N-acetylglucosaminyldiphosphoundecaprenol N-acetyl-beta-D-mannosaminyltransferase